MRILYVSFPIIFVMVLGSCGGSSSNEEGTPSGGNPVTYESVCHELVAICSPNSECTAWAEEMIRQDDLTQCSELKRQCSCS